ncbi:MAG: c-type cytochrome domain-containing protein [Isosphaeraceae bacterium]
MRRAACLLQWTAAIVVGLGLAATSRADEPKPASKAQEPNKPAAEAKPAPPVKPADSKPAPPAQAKPVEGAARVSFLKDIAPILVQNCIACHNTRKTESKYLMTTFAALAKGGQQGEGITLEPGDPDASRFVELLRPDGEPRMPYKQDPLPAEKIALIERWVKEGAKYDGGNPSEDWTSVLRKTTPIVIPESYTVTVPITALDFSPNGANVAASGFHEITLWKTNDGTLARRIPGLPERIYEIAYSPDGKWLAVASGDPGQFGLARLYSAEPDGNAKPSRDLAESIDSVLAVAFSPDSKLVAAGGADRSVRVWEVATGKQVALIEDHADWVTDVAFSPDGKRLATASRDKTCKVFDLEKKESLVTFPGHAQPVYSVTFTPDGKLVASGGEDNQIRGWNPAEDGKQVRQIGAFAGPIFRLGFTPDGKSLIGCSSDKSIKLIKGEGTAVEKTLSGHSDWVYTYAIARDGKTIASGSWDGEVRLWNVADAKLIRTIIAAPNYKPAGQAKTAAK